MEASVVNRTIVRYVKAFSSLTDEACDALLGGVRERRLSPHEILFRQGDPGDAMMIVHHGALSVRVRRPDGLDAEVAVVQGGEVLGEMCVVDPARSCLVLLEGEVEVVKRVGDADRIISTMPTGSLLGQVALVDRSPRCAPSGTGP
jgi:CRP-like cAMP-binding protein